MPNERAQIWARSDTHSMTTHNAYYDNGLGPCASCGGEFGDNALQGLDPSFIDPTGFDLRITPDSPLVDEGLDRGYDLNGQTVGRYNGAAPDIGAHETQ